ncbi:MAG: tRNA pseudouridine(54/55) synthase Pus10 [Candidatus Brockarchaeota archaeon]|nr:tRNA pseudouridine(54/55) synthase Pus10 [Candidatus Brockarchaeota archaeon]
MDLLKYLKKLVVSIPLCDRCLGRQFSNLIPSPDNEAKGKVLKDFLFMNEMLTREEKPRKALKIVKALAESGHGPSLSFIKKNFGLNVVPKPCYICENEINSLIENAAARIIEKSSEIEFKTFYAGLTLPVSIEEKDEKVKSFFKLKFGEALKNELNREIIRKIEKTLQRKPEMKRPDVLFVYDAVRKRVSTQINSIFLKSSYKKLVGGIAQTKWRGTDGENTTPSIEKMLEEILLPAYNGRGLKFHGAGREDVDVKMLGEGRPFIVEILEPKIRNVDLEKLRSEFNSRFGNMVEITGFLNATYSEVPKLKLEAEIHKKSYRVVFETEREVSEEELRDLSERLTGVVVNQRTPLRVLKRRKDKVRKKVVYKAVFRRLGGNLYEASITCSGGLYVKELLHGDEGRTTPSVAGLLNTKIKIVEMEVTGIEGG